MATVETPLTYDNPVKAIARAKLRDFIAKHYTAGQKRNLKVLCFPGAEADGEEALEVKEVYDALGIPRGNIVGLEYDRRKAERLRQAGLGIEVVCEEDWRYLQHTDRKFDVISLDYTGHFGNLGRYSLDLIAARRLLGERFKQGILATNYYGSREQSDTQDNFLTDYKVESLGDLRIFAKSPESAFKRFKDTKLDVCLNEARSRAIQQGVLCCMNFGRAALDPLCVAKKICSDEVIEFLKGIPDNQEFLDECGINEGFRNNAERIARHKEIRIYLRAMYLEKIEQAFSHPEARFYKFLGDIFWAKHTRGYFSEDHESYSYISNKRSPMLFDLWKFYSPADQIPEDFLVFERISPTLRHSKLLPSVRDDDKFKLIMQKLRQLNHRMQSNLKTSCIDRQFLGSSYVPCQKTNGDLKQKQELSKEEAIDLLASGIPAKEIAEAYSGFSERQLAAFKAHVTMGTYEAVE